MKIVAIVQARMRSTRLPGKVLMDLAGEPLLARVVDRLRRSKPLDDVVVATSDHPADEGIVRLCKERNWSCFRGSETDVLDRYYRAALAFNVDMMIRVTSDCPLADPQIVSAHIDRMISRWHETDIVANVIRRTYPLGLSVEVMPFDVLERLHRLSTTAEMREHVTILMFEKPEWFLVDHVMNHEDLSVHRWTVDWPEDLQFARCLFEHFGHDRFSWRDVLALLADNPAWVELDRAAANKFSH